MSWHDDYDEWLRKAIARRRVARGWSQAALAGSLTVALGRRVGLQAISKIETGERKVKAAELVALAALLDMQVIP